MLSGNEKTIKLNLERNSLNIKGCQELSKAIALNSVLKELSIASNQIGLDGVEAISNALLKNQKLELLDVSDNKLGKDGAEKLATGLEKCQLNLRQRSLFYFYPLLSILSSSILFAFITFFPTFWKLTVTLSLIID